MKKLIAVSVVLVMMLLSSCSFLTNIISELAQDTGNKGTPVTDRKISLPDLSNVEEEIARQFLTNKGLLPAIEYEYSDEITKGNVTRTDPPADSIVDPDTKVTLYISLGPDYIKAEEGTINWYQIDPEHPDEWNFSGLQIYENNLYIYCETTFGTSFTLDGFGYASLSDSFENKVPLTIIDPDLNDLPENTEVKAGELFKFYIKVPMTHLESERPTFLACQIFIELNGIQEKIQLYFTASW